MLTASAIGCFAAKQSFIWFGDSKGVVGAQRAPTRSELRLNLLCDTLNFIQHSQRIATP